MRITLPQVRAGLRAVTPLLPRGILRQIATAAGSASTSTRRPRPSSASRPRSRAADPRDTRSGGAPDRRIGWDARADGRPDPGEVCWAWVAYEEDASQGKDRPVLVIGTEGDDLLALQLTSKDHDRDADQERRSGREWMDVGTGAWDAQRRPSEVRLNRLLHLDPAGVRREGATLDRAVFEAVVAAARPWL